MANPFLEERLPVDVRMGATYADEFDVDITVTSAGQEYRSLVQPFPRREFTIAYTGEAAALWDRILALYQRAYGRYAGFRVRCLDDYSTCAMTGAPTAFDHPMAAVSAGVYQLQKRYGVGATPLPIGLPVRTLFKPVAGSVLVAIGSTAIRNADWSVDVTTGRITFAADQTAVISGLARGVTTVLTVPAGHGLVAGQSVHVSGVLGTVQINGRRAFIMSAGTTTITLDIDSSGYANYTSGGAVHTGPQAGETVTGGCEFDIPCRFNSRIDVRHVARYVREAGAIDIIELINP